MYIFQLLRTIIIWSWSPIVLTTLAILGLIYKWEVWIIVSSLISILIIGLIMTVIRAGERRLESVSMRLRQQTGYFNRHFTGTSSLSIFAIIDTLFNLDDPQLWDWARACDMSARVFNTWCDSFSYRLESDTRTGKFRVFLHVYLNELWLLNRHYYEFVTQFHEIAEKIEVSPSTKDQYNRFTVEYNTFVQNFRELIAELKKIAGTEIEPPSVKMANELSVISPLQTSQPEDPKPSQPPDRTGHFL
ncbi:hypothetical protein ACFLWR_02010 [Chloroflexota bacterium]